jgi:pimeloyl-ACP methyl ester carboxylesterase
MTQCLPQRVRRRAVLFVGLPAIAATAFMPTTASAQYAPPSDRGGTNGATVPELSWQPCGTAGAECATATVPLDYDDPTGTAIDLSVSRLPAVDQANKIGSVFWNSGGPGGAAAQDIRDAGADIFSPAVRERFDVIGIDPRGVGDSTPIRCFASADEQTAFFAGAPDIPVSDADLAAKFNVARQFGEQCAANAGPLLSHMSTANVARDMDLMRAAVGDEQLTYLGVSYGTHLGSVYANLFPDRVRAIAIDGNLDAVAWTTGQGNQSKKTPFDTRIQSGAGAAAVLDGFLSECAQAGAERCALAAGGDPSEKWDALLVRLREGPIALPQPDGSVTQLTYSGLVGLTIQALYGSPEFWPTVAQAIQNVYSNSGVTDAVKVMERGALEAKGKIGFAPGDPFDDSFSSVTCSESVNPTDPSAWVKNARREARKFGAAGEFWAWGSLPCATWPVIDEDRYAGPWDNPTSSPILMVNNLFDTATSFESAVNLQSQLADAHLLPVVGYGHVAFGNSTCARDAIDTYLIDQQLPADDAVCNQDVAPFAAPAAANA